jgi:hypothetical protein
LSAGAIAILYTQFIISPVGLWSKALPGFSCTLMVTWMSQVHCLLLFTCNWKTMHMNLYPQTGPWCFCTKPVSSSSSSPNCISQKSQTHDT